MKEVTILSGKGGTGKTSIAAAIASIAKNAIFCDNDVDAADLHLIFQPQIIEEHTFSSSWKMDIDTTLCTKCNNCIDHCRFRAIHVNQAGEYYINRFQCEGCRLCERVCQEGAIHSQLNSSNKWFVSSTRFGTLVHARMSPGEENSGKLVTQVRQRAKELAKEHNADYVINDGPPGIGCAAISSMAGTNHILLLIEPSQTGLHDALRVIELAESFNIKVSAVINKIDINQDLVKEIESILQTKQIDILAKIPFDKEMVGAIVEGKTIIEYRPHSSITKLMKEIWYKLKFN